MPCDALVTACDVKPAPRSGGCRFLLVRQAWREPAAALHKGNNVRVQDGSHTQNQLWGAGLSTGGASASKTCIRSNLVHRSMRVIFGLSIRLGFKLEQPLAYFDRAIIFCTAANAGMRISSGTFTSPERVSRQWRTSSSPMRFMSGQIASVDKA